jgi:hypothetical protein
MEKIKRVGLMLTWDVCGCVRRVLVMGECTKHLYYLLHDQKSGQKLTCFPT